MPRSLLTAAVVLSIMTIPSSAFAQTVNVPFSGTVGGTCTFGTPNPGTLVTNGTNPTALDSVPGVKGQVSVNCNQSANLTISYPVQTSGPSFTPTFKDAKVDNLSSGGFAQASLANSMMLPPGSSNLGVAMIADKGSPLSPGTYGFNVTLTIVP